MRLRILVCFGALACAALASGMSRAETRRYAVVIGANAGDAQDARLRYAEADAAKVAHTLRSVGEFPAAQMLQMNGVTADEVRRALIELNARLRQESADTVLLVYYSGHADAENLHLGGTHLGARELRDILAGSSAGSRVLVIDACRSGAVTRVKGGSPTAPFAVNLGEIPPPSGLAILTSSAEGEDSQESDALAGSFFTHYFNSGLIGAADQNHDGMVTLAEAFSFASEQTYRATVATQAGPQHPTFRFDLGGRQDLVLARPRAPRQGLGTLRFEQAGRYVVHRADAAGPGPVVAEVAARAPGAQVALPEGKYEIILRNADHTMQGTAEVRDGAVASVSADTLKRSEYARLVRKGGGANSAYSVQVLGGFHSAPYTLQGQGPINEYFSSWRERNLGSALFVALRRDARRFSLEARLGWEGNRRLNNSQVTLDTSMFSGTVAGLRAWDLGPVAISVGGEAGLLLMEQKASQWWLPTTNGYSYGYDAPRPSLDLPGQLGTTWSLGPTVGPVLQIGVHVWQRVYVQLDGGAPLIFMRVQSNEGTTSWQSAWRARVMLGLGCYL
jgi:hypothetical protein